MKRMAIRTYQTGGDIEPYDELGRPVGPQPPPPPLVPQEPANQPAPGEAGPITPAVPPADTVPPPRAIDPDQLVKPVDTETEDPDRDLNIWRQREIAKFHDPNTSTVFSHKGDNRPIHTGKGGDFSIETHPEYPALVEAERILQKYNKDPKFIKEHKLDIKVHRLETRIRKDQDQKHKEALAEETRQIQGADYKALPPAQELKLNDDIATALKTYDDLKFGKGNNKLVTQQDRNAAAEQRAGSPLSTLSGTKLNDVVRDIIYLNRGKVGVDDAVNLVMLMGSPVRKGAKGFNGLQGRAAARFNPLGNDAVGNRFVVVEEGPGQLRIIRMNDATYDTLTKQRHKGYDKVEEHKADLKKRLDEERQPGMLGRAFDWGIKELGIE